VTLLGSICPQRVASRYVCRDSTLDCRYWPRAACLTALLQPNMTGSRRPNANIIFGAVVSYLPQLFTHVWSVRYKRNMPSHIHQFGSLFTKRARGVPVR